MNNTLADRLDYIISNLGIKQLDFSRRIQFAQSYVSMVLSGSKKSPGPRFLEAVCREFSVNSEWLNTGKGDAFTIPGLPLSEERAKAMAKFQLLSDDKQKMIEDMIEALLFKQMNDEDDEKKPLKAKPVNRKNKK